MGPTSTPEPNEVVFDKFPEFFKKLVSCKAILYAVKDPYGLAFAPNYLLWFMEDNGTIYKIFVSPDSNIWSRLQYHFEISFPTATDHPWLKEILWNKIEEKINLI